MKEQEIIIEIDISTLNEEIRSALVDQKFTIQLDIQEINDEIRQTIISELPQKLQELDAVEKDKHKEEVRQEEVKDPTINQPQGQGIGGDTTPLIVKQDHPNHKEQNSKKSAEAKKETPEEQKTRIQKQATRIAQEIISQHNSDKNKSTTINTVTTIKVKFKDNKQPDKGRT